MILYQKREYKKNRIELIEGLEINQSSSWLLDNNTEIKIFVVSVLVM